MNRKRPTSGSINRLTLAVPELQSVAKQATDVIYRTIHQNIIHVEFCEINERFIRKKKLTTNEKQEPDETRRRS